MCIGMQDNMYTFLSYFPLPAELDCSRPQNLKLDDTPLGKYIMQGRHSPD